MTVPSPPDGSSPPPGAPLSFKVMVGLAVLYLGWRLVQGVVAFFQWVFR
ncbi:MAG: hypothetical protein OXH10_09765 [bacterium]|nr:hypothetical protein [bacterium]MCY3580614.1 hypothetical protein [bacterium]MCY3652150.1 hypothetical protein [bacterium]MDE0643395.1 hypothetical protein [bacterium]